MADKKLFGSLLGFAGLYLCLRHSISYGRSEFLGDGLVLSGGILLAACYVYEKRLINNFGYDKWRLLFWKFLVGICVMCLFSQLLEPWQTTSYDMPLILSMLYQVFIMTIFCWVSIQYFIAHFSAVSVGAFFFLTPVVGLYADALAGGTHLTRSLITATILMLCGILITTRWPDNVGIFKAPSNYPCMTRFGIRVVCHQTESAMRHSPVRHFLHVLAFWSCGCIIYWYR